MNLKDRLKAQAEANLLGEAVTPAKPKTPRAKKTVAKDDEEAKEAHANELSKKARAKKVSDVGEENLKKFAQPVMNNSNGVKRLVKSLLANMASQVGGGSKSSYLLAGDPGTGKTSFVKQYGKLLGLELVVVEAPHITEEHLINIPFIIWNGDSKKTGDAQVETKGAAADMNKNDKGSFELVRAESNLVSVLRKANKLSDAAHEAIIMKDPLLKELYELNKKTINTIRDGYNNILFLDEFFRSNSVKIKNILRNILNGKIGQDNIPMGTYVLYASNITDSGVDEIPMNTDHFIADFDNDDEIMGMALAPTKESWFAWFKKEYIGDEDQPEEMEALSQKKGVTMNPEVFNAFYGVLKDGDISHNDEKSEVRTSPRRWEQLLLYINANTPVRDLHQARQLMTNVKINFNNYMSGDHSEMKNKILKTTAEIIKKTSGIVVSEDDCLGSTEWRDTLENQLETKMKLGALRKYVPIISGEPGIGKTAHASIIARKLGLALVHIDVSALNKDDATGIPLANMKDGKIETEFWKPALFDLIMKNIETADKTKINTKGKYHYLILFDELSRTSPEVFNGIRKLLLDGDLGEAYKLPSDVLLVGALNPVDNGATELTKHVKDVLDIIPADAGWKGLISYLMTEPLAIADNEKVGFDLNGAIINCLIELVDADHGFKTKAKTNDNGKQITQDLRPFYLQNDASLIYVSAREYSDIVHQSRSKIMALLNEEEFGKRQFSDADYVSLKAEVLYDFAETVKDKIKDVLMKHSMNPKPFLGAVHNYIMGNQTMKEAFNGMVMKSTSATLRIIDILEQAKADEENFYKGKGGAFQAAINYFDKFHDENTMASSNTFITETKLALFDESLTSPEALISALPGIYKISIGLSKAIDVAELSKVFLSDLTQTFINQSNEWMMISSDYIMDRYEEHPEQFEELSNLGAELVAFGE